MYTNKMRYTGLSGIDTQSMIDSLMDAESQKLFKVQKNATLIQWRQDAYRATAKSLKTFQTDFFSLTSGAKLRSKSSFLSSSSTVKLNGVASSAVNIKSSSDAAAGDYSLKVLQLAQSELRKSSEISASINSTQPVDVDNLKSGDSFVLTLDGVSKTFTIDEQTITDMALEGTNAGKTSVLANALNAQSEKVFGKENGENKVTISADGEGLSFTTIKGHDIKISEGVGRDTSITAGLDFVPLEHGDQEEVTFKVISADGTEKEVTVDLSVEEDADPMTATQFANKINKALYDAEVGGIRATVDKDGEKIIFINPGSTTDVKIEPMGANSILELAGFGNDTELVVKHTSVLTDLKIKSGQASGDINDSLETALGITGPLKFKINDVEFEFDSTDSLKTVMNEVNGSAAKVKFSFDNITRTFKLEGLSEGASEGINIEDNGGPNGFFDTFGFAQVADRKAQDALIEFEGVVTSRPTNNFKISGMLLELKEVTPDDETLTISVSRETGETFDNIKSFVDGYNELVEKLNSAVRQKRQRTSSGVTYQPLTENERKSMSDKEVETWEEKAKEGLLYSDSLIREVQSEMRSYLNQSVEVAGGIKLSLYDIGITTSSDYTDGGKLVINEDKLKEAIQENGDAIGDLFTKQSDISASDKTRKKERMATQGLSERLNEILNDAAGTDGTFARKAGIENGVSATNNQLHKQLESEQKRIEELKAYLTRKETYYYAMFSKMEQAITNSNNQMSYLQAQMGGGQ